MTKQQQKRDLLITFYGHLKRKRRAEPNKKGGVNEIIKKKAR